MQVLEGGSGGFLYPAAVVAAAAAAGPQRCGRCGLGFSTRGELVRHQQASSCGPPPSSSSSPESGLGGSPPTPRSPSPLLSCPHCEKTYTSSGALKMHVRTHTLPCRCPQCGRAFADRSNLRAHLQTHAAAKRYQCAACRRSFSRLSLLLRHEHHSAAAGCCDGRHSNDDAARQTVGSDRQK